LPSHSPTLPYATLFRSREVARRSREVARLSERSFGPAVREFRRQWIGTGQRALLGLVIMDAEDGALVSAVTPGGPADQAGIRSGDRKSTRLNSSHVKIS